MRHGQVFACPFRRGQHARLFLASSVFWITQHTSTILRPHLFPRLRSRLQSPFPIGRRAWPRSAAVAAAAALWMHTWAAVTRAQVTAASSEAARRAESCAPTMARDNAFDAPMALEVPRISPRTAPPAAPELASLSSTLSGIVASPANVFEHSWRGICQILI